MPITFPQKPTTSWIIRTKNEEKWLGKVLETMYMQSRLDFEIIIVDSGSADKTLQIVQEYPIRKIINIKQEDFSYGYALNIGISESWGDYIGILSAHSLPISRTWYQDGFSNFIDSNIAGVAGTYSALPDGAIEEKLWDTHYHINRLNKDNYFSGFTKENNFDKPSNTNFMLRKSLWNVYQFDEYLSNSEDLDWCTEMIARGYNIVYDPKFDVYHSHGGLGRKIITERVEEWKIPNEIVNSKKRPSESVSKLFL